MGVDTEVAVSALRLDEAHGTGRPPPDRWSSTSWSAPARNRVGPGRIRQLVPRSLYPVLAAMVTAAVLHLLWWWLVATSGGDLAAQDAWAQFAEMHPGSAYNLAWYGGLHPASYSALSPYIMAELGVRTTMILAGTISAGLLALLIVRTRAVARPLWPAIYGAFALTGNAVSGRVTFGVGTMFALAAVVVIFVPPKRSRPDRARYAWPHAVVTAVLSALAAASSPVAGLFLGLIAAALWLQRRRFAACALGVPPAAVLALTAWLFPFEGEQPMSWVSAILPLTMGICCYALAPKSWRTVRLVSALYALAVLAVLAIPSQIGTNVTRLGLLFGGVVLVAVAARKPRRPDGLGRWPAVGRIGVATLALAILTASAWQVAVAVRDAVDTRPTESWSDDFDPLVSQLAIRDADRARVEVVPGRSHREASALAPYVNLARGWNRQADAERNPIFYGDGMLTPASYRAWLHRWAVGYVVLPIGEPDPAALDEAELVAGGVDYLREVWSDDSWRLYEVESPTPLADSPAVVTSFDATEVVLEVPTAGPVLIRIPASPWLSLVDEDGQVLESPESPSPDAPPVNVNGCLGELEQPTTRDQEADNWTVLLAPEPGTYRIAAPYELPRGTSCPDELLD